MPSGLQRLRSAFLLGCGLLATAASTRAAIVEFTQTSAPAGLLPATNDYVDTATIVSTRTAPDTANSGTYAFTGWTLNNAPARDTLRQARNPAAFTIFEPTQAVANYVPVSQDSDTDGVPDWFELRYLGDLTQAADADLDEDGYSLAVEHTRGTSPAIANEFAAGGVSRRRATNVIGYAAPASGSVQLQTITEPAGLVSSLTTSRTVFAWTFVALPTVPSVTGYRFSGWLVGTTRLDDPTHAQPTSLTVGVNTTAVARYTSETADTDGDRVPDWFELLHLDTLAHAADHDSDGDGISLATEAARATSPRLINTYNGAGFSRRRATKTIAVNLSGYLTYEFRTSPAGLAFSVNSAPPGTVVSSPNYDTTSFTGYSFAYWEINGARQIDPFTGSSLGRLSLTLSAPLVATAHFVQTTADTDGDRVPDWYELRHYGSLAMTASSDSEGDGLTLIEEAVRGGSPHLANQFSGGGLSRRRESSRTIVNLQFFERLRRVLTSGVLAEIFSSDPKTVTGQNFGADAAPALGDWDGDGDLDLFVASAAGLTVYENVGTRHTLHLENRSSAFTALGALITANAPARIALGDWNADGRADLVLGGTDGMLSFISSNGAFSGAVPGAATFTLATESASAAPALGDLDADRRVDLLVLLADGTTRFYPALDGPIPFSAASAVDDYLGTPIGQGVALAIGEINHDGRADVIAADLDGRLWEFHQSPAGTGFALSSKVWAGSGNGFAPRLAIALGDLDGDDDTDALGGTRDGALVGLRDPRVGRPVGLIAASGAQSITLTWDADRQERIKGYHVYRAPTAAGAFARLTELPLALPAFTDLAVSAGQTYYYRVTGITDAYLPGNSLPRPVEGLPSETVSATAGLISFAVRPARASAGNVVHVRLAIANPFAISGAGLQLKLAYDPALLTPVTQIHANQKTVATSAIGRDLVFSDNSATASGQLVITGSGGALSPGDGTLFVLSFRVAPAAPTDASTTVTLTQVTARDVNGHLLAWECTQTGALTVSGTYAEGDLTGDGVVNKDDQHLLTELLKLNARPPTADELSAGDLNADGQLDQDDFVLLKRLLNGRSLE